MEEYQLLFKIVSEFDQRLLLVKGWGVSLSLVAIGLGFKEKTWGYFFLGVVSSLSFWAIESTIKGHQMRYYLRIQELEYYNQIEGSPKIDWYWENAPKIYSEKLLKEERKELLATPKLKEDKFYYNWPIRLFFPHVMLPHVVTAFIGTVFTVLSYRKKGRFSQFGP